MSIGSEYVQLVINKKIHVRQIKAEIYFVFANALFDDGRESFVEDMEPGENSTSCTLYLQFLVQINKFGSLLV